MKKFEEIMAEFMNFCASNTNCAACKYADVPDECDARFVYEALTENAEASAEEVKKPAPFPRWIRVGQWIRLHDCADALRKIVGINGEELTLDNGSMCYKAKIADIIEDYHPIKLRPYTHQEAEKLLGKTLRYTAGNGLPVTALVYIVSRKFFADPESRINGTDFQFYADRDATIDRMPIGVPEIDEEAMKGGAE